MEIKPILEMIAIIFAIITGASTIIAGIVYSIKKIKSKIKLKKNKNDGYYYDRKGKNPYCPQCYEVKNERARIINHKCIECGKVYKYPSVIVEVIPRPKPKLRWGSSVE